MSVAGGPFSSAAAGHEGDQLIASGDVREPGQVDKSWRFLGNVGPEEWAESPK